MINVNKFMNITQINNINISFDFRKEKSGGENANVQKRPEKFGVFFLNITIEFMYVCFHNLIRLPLRVTPTADL